MKKFHPKRNIYTTRTSLSSSEVSGPKAFKTLKGEGQNEVEEKGRMLR